MTRTVRYVALVLLPLIGCATLSATHEKRETSADSRPRILPWLEVNSARAGALDDAVAGMRHWCGVVPEVIITTSPGHTGVYARLLERIDCVRIIPGIKTWPLLDKFDSVEGWRAVSAEVSAAREALGASLMVLENETAIKDYRRGEVPLDSGRLREALAQLPRDLEYIWYPGVRDDDPRTRTRYEAVCRIAADVLNVRFTHRRFDGPRSVDAPWALDSESRLKRIMQRLPIPIVYTYGGPRWWNDDQVPSLLEREVGDTVLIYPGSRRWVESSRRLSELLRGRDDGQGETSRHP